MFVELGSWKHNSNHNRERLFIKNWLCAKLSVLIHLTLIAAGWHSLPPCFTKTDKSYAEGPKVVGDSQAGAPEGKFWSLFS